MKLIFKPFQREKAMMGEIISETTSLLSTGSGVGGYSKSKRFKVGDTEFGGDYATLPFTIQKCLLFKNISTVYEEKDK